MAVAWESDSFTCRYQELQDSTVPLSAEVNRRMAEVVTVGTPTNRKESHIQIQQRILEVGYAGLSDQDRTIVDVEVRDFMSARNISDFNEGVRRWSSSPGRPQPLSGCDRTELLAALRGTLASPFTGTIGTWAEGSPSISKCLPEGVGIYRGFSTLYSAAISVVGLSPTIRLGNSYIGTDKVEHFMTEGFDYYQKQLEGGSLEDILAIGRVEEDGLYGLAASGIKSYGDLASNYSGYLFWRSMTEGSNPYFRCSGDRWQQVRQFSWADYADPTWDEAVNCSDYGSDSARRTVARNVMSLQRSHNAQPLGCPLDTGVCTRIHEIVPNATVRAQVVHPLCLSLSRPPTTGTASESAQ